MFADEIRRAIEAASRITLPSVTALLWRAYGEGKVSDTEAEALSGLIEARTDAPALRRVPVALQSSPSPAADGASAGTPQDRYSGPRKPGVGSRPRTVASMERRRRWAASGRLPPGLAYRFTLAEQAVLALVAAETARRKDCRLAVGQLAAIAGVAETTVRNAIREARRLGLLTVEERRVTGFRNLPNIVCIVSPEWLAWLRLARLGDRPASRVDRHLSPSQGRGCKSAKRTPTQVLESGTTTQEEPSKGCQRAAADLGRRDRSRIRAGGGAD